MVAKPTPFPIFHKDLAIWLGNSSWPGQKIGIYDKKMSNLFTLEASTDCLTYKSKKKYLPYLTENII